MLAKDAQQGGARSGPPASTSHGTISLEGCRPSLIPAPLTPPAARQNPSRIAVISHNLTNRLVGARRAAAPA